MRIAPVDLADLAADHRVVASGISDPRSGMSSSGEFEGYLGFADFDEVVAEYLLSSSGPANVFLHLSDRPLARDDVPLGLVLADLADHNLAREDSQVEQLLRGAA